MYFGRHFARRMGFLTDYYTYFYGGWAKIGRNRYDASRFYPGGMGFRGGVFWPRKKFRWSAHGIDFAGGRPIDILERSGPVMPIVILLVISLFILLVILLVVMLLGIPICNATCNPPHIHFPEARADALHLGGRASIATPESGDLRISLSAALRRLLFEFQPLVNLRMG